MLVLKFSHTYSFCLMSVNLAASLVCGEDGNKVRVVQVSLGKDDRKIFCCLASLCCT